MVGIAKSHVARCRSITCGSEPGSNFGTTMWVPPNTVSAIPAGQPNCAFAGADHVALLLPVGGDFAAGVDQLEQVALAYPA